MTGIEIATIAGTAVTVGDALLVTSAVMGASGAMQKSSGDQAVANYNAQVAEVDAINARNAADYEEKLHRERAKTFLARQRAAAGGVSEGSGLLALEQSAKNLERDALAIRYSGSVDAARSRSRAAADRMQGQASSLAGYYDAGKSLLTGASKVQWRPSDADAGVED